MSNIHILRSPISKGPEELSIIQFVKSHLLATTLENPMDIFVLPIHVALASSSSLYSFSSLPLVWGSPEAVGGAPCGWVSSLCYIVILR